MPDVPSTYIQLYSRFISTTRLTRYPISVTMSLETLLVFINGLPIWTLLAAYTTHCLIHIAFAQMDIYKTKASAEIIQLSNDQKTNESALAVHVKAVELFISILDVGKDCLRTYRETLAHNANVAPPRADLNVDPVFEVVGRPLARINEGDDDVLPALERINAEIMALNNDAAGDNLAGDDDLDDLPELVDVDAAGDDDDGDDLPDLEDVDVVAGDNAVSDVPNQRNDMN